MSISENGIINENNSVNDRDIIDGIVAGETPEQRRDREFKTREMIRSSNDAGALNFFGFLVLLFSNATDDSGERLIDNNTLNKISNVFGIDQQILHQNITSITEKAITPREAASKVYGIIDPETVDWSKASDIDMSLIIHDSNTPTLLNPDLVKSMENNPQIRQMVKWTFDAAEREGLDGNLLANQYWAESKYDPQAESGVGAKGVAQFMPFHKGKWGLENNDSFLDPKTSIDAGARFMKHLTDRLGSQELALVAYNGGEKAIDYVDKNISGNGITIGQWMDFMEQERTTKGVGSRNLWRNQTFEYVTKIDSKYWPPEKLALAQQQKSTLQNQFSQGGVETKDTKQPDPLVASFDGKGKNQIATADNEDHIHSDTNTRPTITTSPT